MQLVKWFFFMPSFCFGKFDIMLSALGWKYSDNGCRKWQNSGESAPGNPNMAPPTPPMQSGDETFVGVL